MAKTLKKLLAITLALSMTMSMLSMTSLAVEGESGEVEHTHNAGGWKCVYTEPVKELDCQHEHNEICGYAAAVAGADCTHTHDDECGFAETVEGVACDHVHGESCGYVEAVACTCGAQPGEDGNIIHTEDCAYVAGSHCTHVCSDGTCAYVAATAGSPCTHTHDETCGYAEAKDEVPCTHQHTDNCYRTVEGYWTCTAPAAEVVAFLTAVAEIPGEITEENWKDAQSKVDAAWELYVPVYDLWEQDNTIWTKEVSDAYQSLKAADQAVKDAQLTSYPITGEWSEDENGKVLTLTGTGESSYVGTFVLVEDGQRVKLVNGWCSDGNLAPFRVVLNGVTEIGIKAFASCKKLTGINLEGVTTIGQQAFYGAFAPEADVTITLNGTAVGTTAFKLSNIDHLVATGLTAIGKQAFMSTTVQDVEIGIADGAELSQDFFYDNKKLTTLTVTGNLLAKNAFRNCPALETVTLNNVTEIGENAFMDCPKLATVAGLDTVISIGVRGFRGCTALTNVDISNMKTIGYEAFYNAGLAGEIDLSNVDYVAFNAFSGCNGLTNISVSANTVLEHSDVFSKIPDLQARIAAILAGQFVLNPANAIETLAPLGWTSNKVGTENDDETYGGTQITKEARWANSDSTVADVTIQAYYTDVAQMDFIFVLDLSNSMAKVGNVEAGDKNARLYDMQSKLLDVTGKLMTTSGYDCRVAFTGFGETSSLTSGRFFTDAGEAEAFINDLQTYYENTDYSLGLNAAKTLVDANADRNTTVVFISDGQPYKFGQMVDEYCGYEAAQAIKDTGVEIYGVLQSIPENELENAQNVMTRICTDGRFFTASQTTEFSEAVNNAIACGFTTYTLVDTVGDDFDLARGTISASAGEVTVSEDGRTITWTITGMPFETHTLTFQENLKQVDGAYPYGSFDTNAGNAELKEGTETVNQVETPELTRNRPYVPPVTSTYSVRYSWTGLPAEATENLPAARSYEAGAAVTADTAYTVGTEVTVGETTYVFSGWDTEDFTMPARNVEIKGIWTEKPAEEDVEETDPPTTETPEPSEAPEPTETQEPDETEDLDDNDTPMAEIPEEIEEPAETEDLDENDTPLAEVPQTGDALWMWLALALLSAAGLVWVGLSEKKGKRVTR